MQSLIIWWTSGAAKPKIILIATTAHVILLGCPDFRASNKTELPTEKHTATTNSGIARFFIRQGKIVVQK